MPIDPTATAAHKGAPMDDSTDNGYWIATNTRQAGGRRVLGPFVSRDLALEVRVYVEAAPKAARHGTTYWVVTGDEVPDA
jgi:hypothetical protein